MIVAASKQSVPKSGLTPLWLGTHARLAYHQVLDPKAPLPDGVDFDPGFEACARFMYDLEMRSVDHEVKVPLVQTAMKVRAVHRSMRGLVDGPDETIPLRERKAWEAVTRFLAYAVQCDDTDQAARGLSPIIQGVQQEIENGDAGDTDGHRAARGFGGLPDAGAAGG